MQTIICATRGGEACRRTQGRAIELAKEREGELIFLYVVDISLVGPVDKGLVDALKEEMARLGRALLRVAQSRARDQGKEARAIILEGNVREKIKEAVLDNRAQTLVIGTPVSNATHQAFSRESIKSFADLIREDLNIEVIVVS
ncbi:MAG: universal stress protein [Anaerolineales bacterium]|nr:universal stress protein [Anaerolineales bacterium]